MNANVSAKGDGNYAADDSLEDEEKIEEDMRSETSSSGTGQLKTPEDERPDKDASGGSGSGNVHHLKTPEDERPDKDLSDLYDETLSRTQKKKEDVQQNNVEATALPQKGTIATIPDNSNNAAQENSAVLDNSDDESVVQPGFMFIPGPDYTGTGIYTGYTSDPDDDNNINDGSVIVQGFLPEDNPSRSRRRNSSAESRRERIQRLIDNAVTLDDSAVQPIPMEDDVDEERNNGVEQSRSNSSEVDDEEVKSGNRRWFLPLSVLVIAACIILAIALPLSLRAKSGNAAQDATSLPSDAVCLPGGVGVRFELAKSILSSITSTDLLEDESTPQGKAIRWIVCNDSISVRLLGKQDPSTGHLPKQNHGFLVSGDSGEAQVTRRYILATLSYSTSQVSPWKDSLNFLSPDLHECRWHRNYTRSNFPFGGKFACHLFNFP